MRALGRLFVLLLVFIAGRNGLLWWMEVDAGVSWWSGILPAAMRVWGLLFIIGLFRLIGLELKNFSRLKSKYRAFRKPEGS